MCKEWSRRSQAGGDGDVGLPDRGRKPERAHQEGKVGGGNGEQSPGEADSGTLGPCRERQMGSLVPEEHLKSWRVQCAFRSSLLLCPPRPLCSEDLWLWVWESWLLTERKGQIAWAVTGCHTQRNSEAEGS